jgi:hypothetical protein
VIQSRAARKRIDTFVFCNEDKKTPLCDCGRELENPFPLALRRFHPTGRRASDRCSPAFANAFRANGVTRRRITREFLVFLALNTNAFAADYGMRFVLLACRHAYFLQMISYRAIGNLQLVRDL